MTPGDGALKLMQAVRACSEDRGTPLSKRDISKLEAELTKASEKIVPGVYHMRLNSRRGVSDFLCRIDSRGTCFAHPIGLRDTSIWSSTPIWTIDYPGAIIMQGISIAVVRGLSLPPDLIHGVAQAPHELRFAAIVGLQDILIAVSPSRISGIRMARLSTPLGVLTATLDMSYEAVEILIGKGPGPVLTRFGINVPNKDRPSLAEYIQDPKVARQIAMRVLAQSHER